MKRVYLIIGLVTACVSGCTVKKTQEKTNGTVKQQQDAVDGWHGPDYYNGVWIQTEAEYSNIYCD